MPAGLIPASNKCRFIQMIIQLMVLVIHEHAPFVILELFDFCCSFFVSLSFIHGQEQVMLMAALLVTRCLQSFPNPFCCASSCVLLSVIAGQEQLMMVVTFLVTCCLHSFPNPFHQLQFKWIRFHSYFHKLIRFHSYLHLLMFYQSVVVHKHVLLKVCFILK